MKDLLLSFDYLSVNSQVYFKSKQKYSTWSGLIFSIFIGLAILVLGVFFFRECVDRLIYFLTSTEEFIANESVNLSSLGFEIIFDVRNGRNVKFPEFERYISLQAISTSHFNLTRCTLEERGFSPYVDGTDNLFGSNWCYPKNMSITTHRYGGGPRFMLVANPCVNQTSRPTLKFSDFKTNEQKDNCYPIDKIEKTLNEQEFYIIVKFKDRQINHTSTSSIFPE